MSECLEWLLLSCYSRHWDLANHSGKHYRFAIEHKFAKSFGPLTGRPSRKEKMGMEL